MNEIKGAMVAIVTPFKNGDIDRERFAELIEFQVEKGMDAIVVCGTTGEAATLSHEEQHSMMDLAVKCAAGRISVICGAGSNNTSEALSLAQHAKKAGADAVLAITPYYNKPTPQGLYQHYAAISDAVDLPIIIYNVPSRTGINMLPETVARLAEIKNVVAVKEASGSIEQASEIIRLCGDRIAVISGDDYLTYSMMCLGAVGVISVVANIVPDLMANLVHLCADGKYGEARAAHFSLAELSKSMFVETNPIPVKTVLAWMGKIDDEFRLPLTSINEAHKDRLKAVVQKYGLL